MSATTKGGTGQRTQPGEDGVALFLSRTMEKDASVTIQSLRIEVDQSRCRHLQEELPDGQVRG